MRELDAIVAVSDVAGFSHFTEGVTPSQLVAALNEYNTATQKTITESGGEVIVFIGDCAFCLWETAADATRQTQIGAGLIKLSQTGGNYRLPNGVKITTRLAVSSGRIVRTETECGGVRQALPLFGESVSFVQRLNAACSHFKKNFLVSDGLPVIWPPGIILTKVDDITVKGQPGSRTIYAVEDAQ